MGFRESEFENTMTLTKRDIRERHRDRIVKILIPAVEHALRFESNPETKAWVAKQLSLLKIGAGAPSILAMQPYGEIYNSATLLKKSLTNLCKIITTQRWITQTMIHEVTIPAWDAGIFLSNEEMQAEIRWQATVIEPQIEEEFRRMWAEEDELKRQRKQRTVTEQAPFGR
jgi:hypothetical protein